MGKVMPLKNGVSKGREPSKLGRRTPRFKAKQIGFAKPNPGILFAGRPEQITKTTSQRPQLDFPATRVPLHGSFRPLPTDGNRQWSHNDIRLGLPGSCWLIYAAFFKPEPLVRVPGTSLAKTGPEPAETKI